MRLLPAILGTLSSLAFASSTTADYSDIWYDDDEEGWGINIVHQDEKLFVTLFVYGQNSQPTWFVASDAARTGSSSTFTGPLYSVTGPYFGAANFGRVALSTVGTLTFTATGVSTANLSYSVDGVTVNKAIERYTFRRENVAGTYLGSSVGTWSNCAGGNGYAEALTAYTVSHDGANGVRIQEAGGNFQCTYSGTYAQDGRFGSISGSGVCSGGIRQTFTATEVAVGHAALTMNLDLGQADGCSFAGRMGGMRRGP